MSAPALYVGAVMHRRLAPRRHRFRYSGFWLLLDLDELDGLRRHTRFLSHNRFNLFSLYDRDHGDGSATPLGEQIRQRLTAAGLDLSGGRIRLLCMPRTLGHCFNPLSIYFCDDAHGSPVALVYQVHNTFGGRHSYVIPAGPSATHRQSCDKRFYVSPFMDMGLRYDFSVTAPDDHLSIGIRASDNGAPVLFASLTAVRRAVTDTALLGRFLRMPAITLKVIAAIHWEALRLWLKGLRLVPRPQS